MSKKITSWSISRAQTFDKCRYWAKLAWIDKIPDTQPRPAADRGTDVHNACEAFVRGKIATPTHEMRHFKYEFSSLRTLFNQGLVTCEDEWAFDRNWKPVDWKSPNAWLRLKLDAGITLTPIHGVVVDYKTGARFNNEVKHAEQTQLYSLVKLLRNPKLSLVTSELWYLDQDELAAFNMKRSQAERYLRVFTRRGLEITECTDFAPNPNIFSCKYCPYHKDKQGDCIYGVDLTPQASRQPQVFDFSKIKAPVDPTMAAEAEALNKSFTKAEAAVKGIDRKVKR